MFNQRAIIQINRMLPCPAFLNSGKYHYEKDFHFRFYLTFLLVSETEVNISNNSVFRHVRPNCKTEADAGACKSDPVYMDTICHKSFCEGRSSISYGK